MDGLCIKGSRRGHITSQNTSRCSLKLQVSTCYIFFSTCYKLVSQFKELIYNSIATCRPVERNRFISTTWLAKRYLETIRLNPNVPVQAFKGTVLRDLQVQISTASVYRTKRKAMKLIDGEHKDQYKDLWDYCLEVKRAMPDSTVFLKKDGDIEEEDRFKRFYMCLGPLKKGFNEFCRPFICLDACFLKGMNCN